MGSIVKVTMPLLSTLAALVIIVHTAEENYDRDYREERRALDVEPPNYDQSWRAVDVQPIISQTIPHNQEGWNDDSPDQPIRRRRRKRKRRPQFSIQDEELEVRNTYILKNDTPALQQDNMETIGRRRKKVNDQNLEQYNRLGYRSEQNLNKPLRRRGQRRRRPLVVDSWPELSEFNRQLQDQSGNEEENEHYKTRNDNMYIIPNKNNEKGLEIAPENQHIYSNEHEEQPILINADDDKTHHGNISPKDRSLSEFSSEVGQPAQSSHRPIINTADKIKDKTIIISNEINKPQEREILDPRSLKALLKRSNGKSLSEILQQNNLSLSDLLNGKAKALSILQNEDEVDTNDSNQLKLVNHVTTSAPLENIPKVVAEVHLNKEDIGINDCDTPEIIINDRHNTTKDTELENHNDAENLTRNENTPKGNIRHRFPIGSRRRLRLRSKTNSTSQRQTNRDIINLASVKYKNSRHINKSKEWKAVVSAMMKRIPSSTEVPKLESKFDNDKITTTTSSFEETTTEELFETTTDPSLLLNTEVIFYGDTDTMESDNTADSNKSYINSTNQETNQQIIGKETVTHEVSSEKPKLLTFLRPLINSSELRRQSYNNRLKRKRLKQKDLNIEEHGIKNIFSTANLVSASEFIETAQTKTIKTVTDAYTTLEDIMTTEPGQTTHVQSAKKSLKSIKFVHPTTESVPFTTQDTAKYEIEEILNDSISNARLSKILKERNMTLTELFEHRERGSSHVHLADIFHNASKEPNPPEPFLSKSLIEPISREIYPLRALLEANLHDPKITTLDTNSTNNLNIPVVMDFGNNVNENGENMGIISLFNNFSKINSERNVQDDNEKSNGNNIDEVGISRESRTLSSEKDAITWNDLITLMQSHQKDHQNEKDVKIETDNSPMYENLKNIKLDEDIEGNRLMVLEDLQSLKNFDTVPTSDELLEIKLYENSDFSTQNTIDSSFNTTTKSVTLATVTIIGLALILFLLTYGMLKWRQQRKIFHNKQSKEDEYVPSPVFENRKGQKINSSTRSKSPMLSSNIYAIDSLDTHAGNESPEYMWDSLRKPFQ